MGEKVTGVGVGESSFRCRNKQLEPSVQRPVVRKPPQTGSRPANGVTATGAVDTSDRKVGWLSAPADAANMPGAISCAFLPLISAAKAASASFSSAVPASNGGQAVGPGCSGQQLGSIRMKWWVIANAVQRATIPASGHDGIVSCSPAIGPTTPVQNTSCSCVMNDKSPSFFQVVISALPRTGQQLCWPPSEQRWDAGKTAPGF